MFSEEKYEKKIVFGHFTPSLATYRSKIVQETHFIILWVSSSSNLPFTFDYFYLTVDL